MALKKIISYPTGITAEYHKITGFIVDRNEGKYVVNYIPKNKLPVEEYLKPQGRFRHLFNSKNEHLIAQLQEEVDRRWERLLNLANM